MSNPETAAARERLATWGAVTIKLMRSLASARTTSGQHRDTTEKHDCYCSSSADLVRERLVAARSERVDGTAPVIAMGNRTTRVFWLLGYR